MDVLPLKLPPPNKKKSILVTYNATTGDVFATFIGPEVMPFYSTLLSLLGHLCVSVSFFLSRSLTFDPKPWQIPQTVKLLTVKAIV